jgi:hypothetical protein
MSPGEAALDALAGIVAAKVVALLRAGDMPGMVDQAGSPLGRRRHMAAVRARVQRGAHGAAIVGRRHLLARDLLEAELAAVSKRAKKQPAASDELADLRQRYGFDRRVAS